MIAFDVGATQQYVLGDRAVDVRDHNLIGTIPQKDPRRAHRHARVRRSDRELYSIGAELEIELFLP